MSNFDHIIRKIAAQYSLNPVLVKAICIKESNCDTWAIRFEPKWSWFVTPEVFAKSNRITAETEKYQQSCSHGLMQVMGSVCRELSFRDNLNKMYIPEIGIEYGCKKLAQLLKKYGDLPSALAAYNAGNPRFKVGQDYALGVLNIIDDLTKKNDPITKMSGA